MSKKLFILTIVIGLLNGADAQDIPPNQFITLGTNGGPLPVANRSQPANALLVGDHLYLVDAGDGTAGQLAKAGLRLQDVKGLFLSHNHFDHTGGVLALLGLRMQLNVHSTLEVYGPPGTQSLIDGLLVGMEPAMKAAYGMPGQSWSAHVEVTEVVDGATLEFAGMTATAAENSHFRIPEDSGTPEKAIALSFRFDFPDRSIVYTGDTGPSEAVERLALGADVLVSEMMDIPAVLARVKQVAPDIPERDFGDIAWHLYAHHLLPGQVGELAARAKVERVIVTHMAPNIATEEDATRYRQEIGHEFDGEIIIANDLDRF